MYVYIYICIYICICIMHCIDGSSVCSVTSEQFKSSRRPISSFRDLAALTV